jgi:hypothetical protein
MPFDPLPAVGLVLRQPESDHEHTFLGSCFSLRDSTVAVTRRIASESFPRSASASSSTAGLARTGSSLCQR